MALSDLQRRILSTLATNRSASSYVAGDVALNRDWPCLSDDIDIFHDTDEEIVASADRDLETIKAAGFQARVDIEIYGLVEATIGDEREQTQIQWMSESRRRFLPLVRDAEWGARLAHPDLAVNKIVAASTRRKARDLVDVHAIGRFYCPLGPLIMAAAGKPPFFSPLRIIEETRRLCLGLWDEDILAVRGLPEDWTPLDIRAAVTTRLDEAARYAEHAPEEIVGRLALDRDGRPLEIEGPHTNDVQLRAPTEEPEVMPQFKNSGPIFDGQSHSS